MKSNKLIILFVVISVVVLILGIINYTSYIKIPDITGKDLEAANNMLQTKGLKSSIGSEIKTYTFDSGVVKSYDIKGKHKKNRIKKNAEVVLNIYKKYIKLPSNEGLNLEKAKKLVSELGLKSTLKKYYILPEIRHQSIEFSTSDCPEDGNVVIKSYINLPEISKWNLNRVKNKLQGMGFNVDTKYIMHPSVNKNQVIGYNNINIIKENSTILIFISKGKIPNMIFIKEGEFQMGDTFNEGEHDEFPIHKVILDNFYIGKYEVTVKEFRKFINDTGYITDAEKGETPLVWCYTKGYRIEERRKQTNWRKPIWSDWESDWKKAKDNFPVSCVSWFDAINFCNWLSEQYGFEKCYTINNRKVNCNFNASGIRLPTEAEWEFAARCEGKKIRYTWGNSNPKINGKVYANLFALSCDGGGFPLFNNRESDWPEWGEFVSTGFENIYDYSFVGEFYPNSKGIYDMTGNVHEWCWDNYDPMYYRSSPQSNPKNSITSNYIRRVYRGGSYSNGRANSRCANRMYLGQYSSSSEIGFRLCMSATGN